MKGRKPKPGAIREIQGNPGRRPINAEAPKLPLLHEVPAPPAFLEGLAREKWLELAGMLVVANVLTGGDLHNLEGFCRAYERWREAEAHVAKHGVVVGSVRKGFRKNPAATVANESLKQLRDFASLLGLDPSSRERLHIHGAPVQPASKENRFHALPGGKGAA